MADGRRHGPSGAELARGFASVAEDYERGRPEYPAEVLALVDRELGLGPGRTALDLAAGTGKLTRALSAAGARVVAIEPLAELRASLRADEVIAGRAEAIPLGDAAVDVAVVGDAWHWFDHARAADELARVVRPGGGVALLWQTPPGKAAPDWLRSVYDLTKPFMGDHPNLRDEQGRPALDAHPAFDGLRLHTVPFVWTPQADEFVAYVMSWSFIGALPESDRERVRGEIAGLVPGGPLALDFEARAWVTRRRAVTPAV